MKYKKDVAIRAYSFETEITYSVQHDDYICEGIACPSQYDDYICEGIACPSQHDDYICEGIHNDCLSCGEDIQHPLCPNCISKGFEQWIQKFPNEQKEIKLKLKEFMSHHNSIKGKSKSCVSCGKNKTHICPYCFTEYLHNLIKEAGIGVRAMSEFLFIFNFDFEHKGYFKELEVYGWY